MDDQSPVSDIYFDTYLAEIKIPMSMPAFKLFMERVLSGTGNHRK